MAHGSSMNVEKTLTPQGMLQLAQKTTLYTGTAKQLPQYILAALMLTVHVIISKIFYSDTTSPIRTKFGMKATKGVLYRTDVVIFYPWENMAAVTKN